MYAQSQNVVTEIRDIHLHDPGCHTVLSHVHRVAVCKGREPHAMIDPASKTTVVWPNEASCYQQTIVGIHPHPKLIDVRVPRVEVVPVAVRSNDDQTLIAPIHDRMPVILPPEAERAWLDPALDGKPEALRDLLRPVAADALRACPVSRRINSTRNDGPELIQASDEPSLGFS